MPNRDSDIVLRSRFVYCELWTCNKNSILGSVVPWQCFFLKRLITKILNLECWCHPSPLLLAFKAITYSDSITTWLSYFSSCKFTVGAKNNVISKVNCLITWWSLHCFLAVRVPSDRHLLLEKNVLGFIKLVYDVHNIPFCLSNAFLVRQDQTCNPPVSLFRILTVVAWNCRPITGQYSGNQPSAALCVFSIFGLDRCHRQWSM